MRFGPGIHVWALAVAALVAVGCGGGGGAGGEAGNPIEFGVASVQLDAVYGSRQTVSADVPVHVTAPDAAMAIVGFPKGSVDPGWLGMGIEGGGANYSLHVGVDWHFIPPQLGTFRTTVRVAVGREDYSLIAFRDLPVTLTVRRGVAAQRTPLEFRGTLGGDAPASQALSLSGTQGVQFTASADQPWVQLGTTSGTIGSSPISLPVGVDPTGLGPGVHEATVSILGGDQGATVVVRLEVVEPEFTAYSEMLAATVPSGGVAPTISGIWLTLATRSRTFSWSVETPTWLHATPSSGEVGGDQRPYVEMNADASALPPGTYQDVAHFVAVVEGTPVHADAHVTLTVTPPTLVASTEAVALGGASGHDLGSVPVRLTLDGAARAFPFTAVASAPWLTVSPSSGEVSGTPITVSLSPLAVDLSAGAYAGSVEFTAVVNGVTARRTVQVSMALDQDRLVTSDAGVAFTSLPGTSVLSRSLRLRSSRGAVRAWTASTQASWLSVTRSGTTDGELLLEANPAGLDADRLYLAEVAIQPDDPQVAAPLNVRVGLWVGSTAAAPRLSLARAGPWYLSGSELVADPIRPYVYVHDGGERIDVIHVYSGAQVGTFTVAGSALGSMAVAADGSRLFVLDRTRLRIVPVDLDGGTVGAAIADPLLDGNTQLGYARPGGTGVIFTSYGHFHDAATGALLGPRASWYGNAVASSRDGRLGCMLTTDSSYSYLACFTLDGTGLSDRIVVGTARTGEVPGYGADVAVSPDATEVYVASSASQFMVFDPASTATRWLNVGAFPGTPLGGRPRSLDVDAAGRILGGTSALYVDEDDAWIYGADLAVQGSARLAAWNDLILPRELVFSGDGRRVAALTEDRVLLLVTP